MVTDNAPSDDPAEIAESYIHYWESEASKAGADQDMSGWERVEEIVRTDPRLAWEVILELIERRPSEAFLGIIASGPMEDLMVRHGETVIDIVAAEARRSAAFKRMIAGVWLSRSDTPVCKRFCQIAGINPVDG